MERKTEEPADWKENIEPEGDQTNRTRLRRKSTPRRYDALDEAREMETTDAFFIRMQGRTVLER